MPTPAARSISSDPRQRFPRRRFRRVRSIDNPRDGVGARTPHREGEQRDDGAHRRTEVRYRQARALLALLALGVVDVHRQRVVVHPTGWATRAPAIHGARVTIRRLRALDRPTPLESDFGSPRQALQTESQRYGSRRRGLLRAVLRRAQGEVRARVPGVRAAARWQGEKELGWPRPSGWRGGGVLPCDHHTLDGESLCITSWCACGRILITAPPSVRGWERLLHTGTVRGGVR